MKDFNNSVINNFGGQSVDKLTLCINKLGVFLLYCSVIVNALFITGTTLAFSLKHAPNFALKKFYFCDQNFFMMYSKKSTQNTGKPFA